MKIPTESRTQLIDITDKVQEQISKGAKAVLVSSMHTTCGVTVNEGADPSVKDDILRQLEKIAPKDDGYSHAEGNSDSHIKTSLMGNSVTVPVKDGQLQLGTWQSIYLAEFDGPRERTVELKFL